MARWLSCLLILLVATTSAAAQQLRGRTGERTQPSPNEEQTERLVPLRPDIVRKRFSADTPAQIQLGRLLFFDPRLSGDNQMSCSTCHLPDKAFADGLPRAVGHEGAKLPRNTPGLLNVGLLNNLLWDGRAKSLEAQALEPIQSAQEMNQDLDELEQELESIAEYTRRFRRAFDAPPTRDGVARALAAFQRTLVTEPAPFDRFLEGDEAAISPAAKRGLELFVGPAGCIRCHWGPMLTDGKYYRLGVSTGDLGRGAVTGERDDDYKFRTPPLRNIAETAPYMHDGSMATLDDVVMFYFRGVPAASSRVPLDVEPLVDQSFSHMEDLVAFLRTLSGPFSAPSPPELPP